MYADKETNKHIQEVGHYLKCWKELNTDEITNLDKLFNSLSDKKPIRCQVQELSTLLCELYTIDKQLELNIQEIQKYIGFDNYALYHDAKGPVHRLEIEIITYPHTIRLIPTVHNETIEKYSERYYEELCNYSLVFYVGNIANTCINIKPSFYIRLPGKLGGLMLSIFKNQKVLQAYVKFKEKIIRTSYDIAEIID